MLRNSLQSGDATKRDQNEKSGILLIQWPQGL